MLESLVSFRLVNEKPYYMFLWALLIAAVGIFLSFRLPIAIGVDSGFISVFFILLASVFFITTLIKKEEKIEEKLIAKHLRLGFWHRHERDMLFLLYYFAGLTVAFALASFLLPDAFFGTQMEKIKQITGFTGQATAMAAADRSTFFMDVFLNNVQVALFSFFFSFLFGAGAVFIFIWNASVLGVYIGQLSAEAWHIPGVALMFIPHGVPEIAGYLAAGLAGGILSFALIRRKSSEILKTVALDSFMLMALSVLLIFAAAAIEAYV